MMRGGGSGQSASSGGGGAGGNMTSFPMPPPVHQGPGGGILHPSDPPGGTSQAPAGRIDDAGAKEEGGQMSQSVMRLFQLHSMLTGGGGGASPSPGGGVGGGPGGPGGGGVSHPTTVASTGAQQPQAGATKRKDGVSSPASAIGPASNAPRQLVDTAILFGYIGSRCRCIASAYAYIRLHISVVYIRLNNFCAISCVCCPAESLVGKLTCFWRISTCFKRQGVDV